VRGRPGRPDWRRRGGGANRVGSNATALHQPGRASRWSRPGAGRTSRRHEDGNGRHRTPASRGASRAVTARGQPPARGQAGLMGPVTGGPHRPRPPPRAGARPAGPPPPPGDPARTQRPPRSARPRWRRWPATTWAALARVAGRVKTWFGCLAWRQSPCRGPAGGTGGR